MKLWKGIVIGVIVGLIGCIATIALAVITAKLLGL